MTTEPQAIEVEIVEIDGMAPPPSLAKGREEVPQWSGSPDPWRGWQGRIRTLDARWWPLWLFLGIVALALMLTLGVVIGAVWLIFRIVTGFFRSIFH